MSKRTKDREQAKRVKNLLPCTQAGYRVLILSLAIGNPESTCKSPSFYPLSSDPFSNPKTTKNRIRKYQESNKVSCKQDQ